MSPAASDAFAKGEKNSPYMIKMSQYAHDVADFTRSPASDVILNVICFLNNFDSIFIAECYIILDSCYILSRDALEGRDMGVVQA